MHDRYLDDIQANMYQKHASELKWHQHYISIICQKADALSFTELMDWREVDYYAFTVHQTCVMIIPLS